MRELNLELLACGCLREKPFLWALCDGSVAQSVEQQTENLRVGGSIPPQTTIFRLYNQLFLNLAQIFALVFLTMWIFPRIYTLCFLSKFVKFLFKSKIVLIPNKS